jgi:hypothetical protein
LLTFFAAADRLPVMSVWEQQSVDAAVRTALGSVHINNPDGHHFGAPYMTAYQLANVHQPGAVPRP